ncbi:hypothetical protein NKH77_28965 [Streptomyces sp. M19]
MAETVGWHSGQGEAPEAVRTRMLRLVRALKLTFGRDVEDAPDFALLRRGRRAGRHVAGRRGSRRRGSVHAGPAAAGDRGAPGVRVRSEPGRRPPGAGRGGGVPAEVPTGSPLDFVTLPAVKAAAEWLDDDEAEDEAVEALKLSGPGKVGRAELSRIFWARVRAEETLSGLGTEADVDALAAKAFHLAPGTKPGGRRDDLLSLLTRAFATGRNASDQDVLAAYDLEEFNAYKDTAVRTVRARTRGTAATSRTRRSRRRWTCPRSARPTGWWTRRGGSAREGRADPYLVRVTRDDQNPARIKLVFDGDTYRVPVGEFVELLAHDPTLLGKDEKTSVVLTFSGLDNVDSTDLAKRLAQRLGRHVWWTNARTDLAGIGDSGSRSSPCTRRWPPGCRGRRLAGDHPGQPAPPRTRRVRPRPS